MTRTRVALAAVAVMLVVVRVAAAVALRHSFFTSGFPSYDTVAHNVVSGHGLRFDGSPFADDPPVYPFLVTAAYWIGGRGWWSIAAMQTVLDLASLTLLFVLGRALFEARVALVACACFAVYPLLASQSVQLLDTAPFVLALLAYLVLACRAATTHRARDAAFAGALAGVGFEIRSEMIVLLAIFPLLLALRGVWSRRALLAPWAAAAAAFVLVATPWTVRNAVVFHRFEPGPAKGGLALWEGNSPHAAAYVRAGRSGDLLFSLPDTPRPRASRDPYVRGDFYYREALRWIRAHPGGFAAAAWAKLVALWSWNLNPLTPNDRRWKELLYTASYLPVLVLAAASLVVVRGRERRRSLLFLLAVLAALTVAHVVVVGYTRMRVTSDPLLMLMAASALVAAAIRMERA